MVFRNSEAQRRLSSWNYKIPYPTCLLRVPCGGSTCPSQREQRFRLLLLSLDQEGLCLWKLQSKPGPNLPAVNTGLAGFALEFTEAEPD